MEEFIIEGPEAQRIKRSALSYVGALSPKRKYRVVVTEQRERRSDRQNKWYFPCIVKPFAEWLTETQGTTYTREMAHEVLRRTFLEVDIINADTGEVVHDHEGKPLTRLRSTTELNTKDFSDYCEKCRDMLAQTCDIIVADPDPDHCMAGGEPVERPV